MWILALTASAQTYNTDDVVPPFTRRSKSEWTSALKRRQKQKKVRIETVDGTGRVPVDKLADLEKVELVAAWLALGGFDVGREYDLVLAGSDGMQPVTVWLEAKDHLVVAAGPSIALPGEGPPIDALVETYGLGGADETQGPFEPRVRGVIEGALAKISDAERSALSDVTLARVPGKGPESRGQHLNPARFEAEDGASQIAFYDDLLKPAALFVGPVDSPRHTALMVTLHEIAHAIDSAHIRLGMARFNAAVRTYNDGGAGDPAALEQERARLESDRDVFTGFRERYGAITAYGKTSDAEAFAEAFALFRIDPAALERVSPEASEWFTAGGHLGRLGDLRPVP